MVNPRLWEYQLGSQESVCASTTCTVGPAARDDSPRGTLTSATVYPVSSRVLKSRDVTRPAYVSSSAQGGVGAWKEVRKTPYTSASLGRSAISHTTPCSRGDGHTQKQSLSFPRITLSLPIRQEG